MSVKQIVEETGTRAGRWFDLLVVGLILISIADFSIETLPDLSPGTLSLLRWVETISVLLFTIEYLLRVLVADRKVGFIFSFFGLIDLAAILPFYIAVGVDPRSVRAIRLVRLLRMGKLARYSDAMNRFRRAAVIAGEELIVFLGVAGMLM